MSDETDLLEELLGPGAGVYRIFGEGQQFGSLFDDPLEEQQFGSLFDDPFRMYELENALALGAAKEAGLDYGGLFGAPIPISIQPVTPAQTPEEKTLEEEKQTLLDVIREAGGEVGAAAIEGTADLGNLIFQTITLGQGPKLEAVIPNILDIVSGGIGGTLVLGGGQTPATVIGTAKTGIGADTKVGVQDPLGSIINIFQQGGNLMDVVRQFPSVVASSFPTIVNAAATAGYAFDEDDKNTVVGLGIEPSILRTGADADTPVIRTALSDADAPVIRTALSDADAPVIRTSLPDREIVRTALPLADKEIVRVLEDLGGRPAVPGGYDEEVVRTALPLADEEIVRTGETTTDGGDGGGTFTLLPSLRGVREEPGDVVNIEYLYDFAKGLDQPFITAEEERIKNLYTYAEGGEVANEDAVDMLTRRPGEYGRSYFTPGQFVPTGTALGGAALNANAIQIPQYTYQRELLPQFGGPAAGTTTQTTMPAGTNVYTPPTLSDTLGQEDIANLLSNITGIFGGGAETTPAAITPAAITPAATTPAAITPAAITPAAITPAAITPVVEDEYKLDIAGDIGEIATTSVTPYGAIPVDQDYTQEEKDIVAQAIASGEATIPQVAGRFGVTTGDVIEELLRGGYQTPADVVESLGYTGGVEGLIVELAAQGRTTPEEIVGYFGNNPEYPEYQGITTEDVSDYLRRAGVPGYAGGGVAQSRGYYLGGTTDGMADQIPATINNIEPARLSDGEFVIPADVVSHLGNGNSDAGAQQLYSMMDRVRKERTGTTKQGPMINPTKMMPA